MIRKARNMKRRICAIPAEVPAIPPKPNAPAMIATTTNTRAQYNMLSQPHMVE